MPLLFNCDMGEGITPDAHIMPHIDQANICCGVHAGDSDTSHNTIMLAKNHGVSVGAHPSYNDRENFGRISLDIPLHILHAHLWQQLTTIHQGCIHHNVPLDYVKPHGALNHDIIAKPQLFIFLCDLIRDFNKKHTLNMAFMVTMTPQKSHQQTIADAYGLNVLWELFADRAYNADGTLRERNQQGAVHTTPDAIVAQVDSILKHQAIPIYNSAETLNATGATTLCIHGDNPASIQALPQLRKMIEDFNIS